LTISPRTTPPESDSTQAQLCETRAAFDSVAADYDGPRGNNPVVQDMRAEMWRTLEASFPAGSRLLDIGCGTGLDAVHLGQVGYQVMATDHSSQMVARTEERAAAERVQDRVRGIVVGAHELGSLPTGEFDGAYSNLGALNCVPDLAGLAASCARLLKSRGLLVFNVIGRVCPWEIAHYARRRNWRRIGVRFARGAVPVGMNKRVVWTRYYTPREFYRFFAGSFALRSYRGICVFVPPPYLTEIRDRQFDRYRRLWRMDSRFAGLPLLRALGDHFLMVMIKR
jgi:SAM-dependent methyltransferase